MRKSILMCAAAGIFLFFEAGQILAQAGPGPVGSAVAPGATSSDVISPGEVTESGSIVTPAGEANPGMSPSGGAAGEESDSTGCVQ